jgi:hypothetical protein
MGGWENTPSFSRQSRAKAIEPLFSAIPLKETGFRRFGNGRGIRRRGSRPWPWRSGSALLRVDGARSAGDSAVDAGQSIPSPAVYEGRKFQSVHGESHCRPVAAEA